MLDCISFFFSVGVVTTAEVCQSPEAVGKRRRHLRPWAAAPGWSAAASRQPTWASWTAHSTWKTTETTARCRPQAARPPEASVWMERPRRPTSLREEPPVLRTPEAFLQTRQRRKRRSLQAGHREGDPGRAIRIQIRAVEEEVREVPRLRLLRRGLHRRPRHRRPREATQPKLVRGRRHRRRRGNGRKLRPRPRSSLSRIGRIVQSVYVTHQLVQVVSSFLLSFRKLVNEHGKTMIMAFTCCKCRMGRMGGKQCEGFIHKVVKVTCLKNNN